MKNQVIKRLKKTLATVLTVSMLAGLGMVASARTYDESENPGVITYEDWSQKDYSTHFANNTAPDEIDNAGTGKLFAGWFLKDGNAYKPLEEDPGANKAVYAKFVPAEMLSVKVQNKADTVVGSGSTSLKILTGIDSLNYAKVGFELSVVLLSEDGKTWNTEAPMANDVEVENVYWTLKSGETTYNPSQFFGNAAKYFGTTWVTDIGNANYDKIICIKPYIKTLDGATVDGLTKYAHVEDGLAIPGKDGYRWVNVPINVRDTQGVAAGVLKLAKENNGWDCVEVECGKLFQEMDYAIKSDESVKLVGNLSSMTTDAKANTIYANVRFQVPGKSLETALTGYTFNITEEDFANVAETQYTTEQFPVWDVKY